MNQDRDMYQHIKQIETLRHRAVEIDLLMIVAALGALSIGARSRERCFSSRSRCRTRSSTTPSGAPGAPFDRLSRCDPSRLSERPPSVELSLTTIALSPEFVETTRHMPLLQRSVQRDDGPPHSPPPPPRNRRFDYWTSRL